MYVVISFLHKFHQRTLFHRRIVLEHFDLDQQIHSGSEFRINDETLYVRLKSQQAYVFLIRYSMYYYFFLFFVLLFLRYHLFFSSETHFYQSKLIKCTLSCKYPCSNNSFNTNFFEWIHRRLFSIEIPQLLTNAYSRVFLPHSTSASFHFSLIPLLLHVIPSQTQLFLPLVHYMLMAVLILSF